MLNTEEETTCILYAGNNCDAYVPEKYLKNENIMLIILSNETRYDLLHNDLKTLDFHIKLYNTYPTEFYKNKYRKYMLNNMQ